MGQKCRGGGAEHCKEGAGLGRAPGKGPHRGEGAGERPRHPTGSWHSLISPGGLRSKGCSAHQGGLRAALITVSEYLQGQNRQVLESSSISSCRGWHSKSRAHSGTSEDDEGRTGGAPPSPSLPGAAGDLPARLGHTGLGATSGPRIDGFYVFSKNFLYLKRDALKCFSGRGPEPSACRTDAGWGMGAAGLVLEGGNSPCPAPLASPAGLQRAQPPGPFASCRTAPGGLWGCPPHSPILRVPEMMGSSSWGRHRPWGTGSTNLRV